MKRFWTDVDVADGLVRLDGKPVRTPGRLPLTLPTLQLAEAVADEWRAIQGEVDPRAMPLTGLANAAIERAPDAASLAVYGQTDLLCYRTDEPPELVAREAGIWDPLLDWARARYDVAFVVAAGIVHQPQPLETVTRLGAALAACNAWQRTGLAPLITIGGSLVVALMCAEGAISPASAFDACHLDEMWQAERWGEDGMATADRDARRQDFCNAARFIALL